jgi:iron complex outermembrane receptor protein
MMVLEMLTEHQCGKKKVKAHRSRGGLFVKCPCRSLLVLSVVCHLGTTHAQSASSNVIQAAEDAFGTSAGRESIGLYGEQGVRGFSPAVAGNFRIEGLYFDQQAPLNGRVRTGSSVRVGLNSMGYAFPAPTGIVDVQLRKPEDVDGTIAISYGPSGGYGVEFDSNIRTSLKPVTATFGVSTYRNVFGNGGDSTSASTGAVFSWGLLDGVDVSAFIGAQHQERETAQPTYIVEGVNLPRYVERGEYPGPQWARADSDGANFGLLAHAQLGNWTVRGGLFRSVYSSGLAYQNLIVTDADGAALREVIAFPASGSSSTSGELRLSYAYVTAVAHQTLTLSLRGRDVVSKFGGAASLFFDSANINDVLNVERPVFSTGETERVKILQYAFGVAYGLVHRGGFEANAGIQRFTYKKRVASDGAISPTINLTAPWLSASYSIEHRVLVYGNFVMGQEDSGAAPGYSKNGNEVLPALSTRQWDIGIRYKPSEELTTLIGVYRIVKPYFALDQQMFYRRLGSEVHQGLEFSVKARPLQGLDVVAGATVSKPKVEGADTLQAGVGPQPVGQSKFTAQINADCVLPFAKSWSLDGGLSYYSRQAASTDNKIDVPASSSLNLGARWVFKAAGKPADLRFLVSNVTNRYYFIPVGSRVFVPSDPRSYAVYLTFSL